MLGLFLIVDGLYRKNPLSLEQDTSSRKGMTEWNPYLRKSNSP